MSMKSTCACRPAVRERQSGAALLTAMIIVTLVATLASAMVWQQWRAVQVESAERARTQSAWILSAAVEWAKLILRENTKNLGAPITLTDTWATPLAEARLSTFLAVDKSNTDDGPEAFLSGNITDANARYNLGNVAQPRNADDAKAQLETLARLCETAGIDASVADLIATGLRRAVLPQPDAAAPLLPQTVDQLSWLGLDAATVAALRPYVMLLPGLTRTALNVNTASAEVLAAVADIDTATAEQLVQTRQRTPYKLIGDFNTRAGLLTANPDLSVRSNEFIVNGRLRLVDRVLFERSILQREPTRGQFVLLRRERIAGLDQAGG